ncbi:MAG: DNA polymerase I, partial [Thermodesulfobacteriota bacterium]
DAKRLYLYCLRQGINVDGVTMDTSLASYLLDPSGSKHDIESVAFTHLGRVPTVATKKGKTEQIEIDSASFASERALLVLDAAPVLTNNLAEEGLGALLVDMELPLAMVLAEMELCGIKLNSTILEELSVVMAGVIESLEESIYKLAGEGGGEFNINSPKQLSVLLFEKMGITPLKKTKTGFSTDESVLKRLSEKHEIAKKIVTYRQVAKLKSTYVDALVTLVNPATGRIHTSFNQTVTATGRLSSSRPNLQNIPVRGEYAETIRAAFVAREGTEFFSADYSQIELRLVAHMSDDPVLVTAFKEGADIHSITAAEVFGIMPGLVTSEMRRRAKAINFGIIYGMGPFGLAGDLEISMKEAADYIENYFAHYKLVKQFIDDTIAGATEAGYTTTLFNRKRFIPELRSTNDASRRFGERMAVNTPIQGTAADMIKAAMIKIDARLKTEKLASKMLLQIHDELLFEVPTSEKESLAALVTEEMEGVLKLKVPVEVNVKFASNWSKA